MVIRSSGLVFFSIVISLTLFLMMQNMIEPIKRVTKSQNIKYSTIGFGNIHLPQEEPKNESSVFKFISFSPNNLIESILMCNYIYFYPNEFIASFKENFNPMENIQPIQREDLITSLQ